MNIYEKYLNEKKMMGRYKDLKKAFDLLMKAYSTLDDVNSNIESDVKKKDFKEIDKNFLDGAEKVREVMKNLEKSLETFEKLK